MNKSIIITTAILALITASSAFASGNHSGHEDSMAHGSMQIEQMQDAGNNTKDMFLVKKEIDGYTVSFHAMPAKKGMQHGGTHNFMVKIEQDGKAVDVAAINSKVTHPNGQSESKMMMKMGDWYMAAYDLGHEGQHQLMVLFKMEDGQKHFGGVAYPKQ